MNRDALRTWVRGTRSCVSQGRSVTKNRIESGFRHRLVRPLSRAYKILRLRDAPLMSRLTLLRAPREKTVVALRCGAVFLHAPGAEIDLRTFDEIFVDEDYRGDYCGAYVVDIGAHKGYFGAYAALHGARTVISYEPEETNFRLLADTARLFRCSDFTWIVHHKAVGREEGVATLHVSDESWAHSLDSGVSNGLQEDVDVVAMSSILHQAPATERVIVKIDIEGMECDVVLGTSQELWRKALDVFVETHEFAACSWDALASHLEGAGFNELPDQRGAILRMSRVDWA
jgi:FkbM family methyltransferase